MSVQEILATLDPHWDRVLRQPMSKGDVDKLARQVGLPMPRPLNDYLLAVGLFQDLTHGDASPFQIYDSPEEFVAGRRFLSEILPEQQALFPFGDDGAGNVFCLSTAADATDQIYLVDHETGKVAKRKDFSTWLEGVVAK